MFCSFPALWETVLLESTVLDGFPSFTGTIGFPFVTTSRTRDRSLSELGNFEENPGNRGSVCRQFDQASRVISKTILKSLVRASRMIWPSTTTNPEPCKAENFFGVRAFRGRSIYVVFRFISFASSATDHFVSEFSLRDCCRMNVASRLNSPNLKSRRYSPRCPRTSERVAVMVPS